jgi:hypothetical protein
MNGTTRARKPSRADFDGKTRPPPCHFKRPAQLRVIMMGRDNCHGTARRAGVLGLNRARTGHSMVTLRTRRTLVSGRAPRMSAPSARQALTPSESALRQCLGRAHPTL